jgi:hypothetical protein
MLLVEETTYVDMKELPLALLDQAQVDFSQKNFGEASSNIRAASKIIRTEVSTDPKMDPKKVADRLDKLADQVKKQEIKSDRQLNDQLAMIAQDEALHSRLRAEKAWAEKQVRRAGHDMEASVAALEHAAKWSGKKIEGATAGAVSDVRKVSVKLIKGADATAAEVGKGFERLGNAISGMGRTMTGSAESSSQGQGSESATTQPQEGSESSTTTAPLAPAAPAPAPAE